mmetsp:Transcript_32772/g.88790  ORF Transcript_32772/g.88790 Transcript_32772/m.88790 type:complete len:361 (-) Transcript_32772:97-1179(-)
MCDVLRMQVLQRHRALVEDVGCARGPTTVVLLRVQGRGHRRVALGDPGHERVLGAELRLDVEHGLVGGQAPPHHCRGLLGGGGLGALRDDAQAVGGRGGDAAVCARLRLGTGRLLAEHSPLHTTQASSWAENNAAVVRLAVGVAALARIGGDGVEGRGLRKAGALDLDPRAMVAGDVGVAHARPSRGLAQNAALDLSGVARAGAVLDSLDCVFAAVKAVAAAPDLTKGTTAQELEPLEVLLEARGQAMEGAAGVWRFLQLRQWLPDTGVGLDRESSPELRDGLVCQHSALYESCARCIERRGIHRNLLQQVDDDPLAEKADIFPAQRAASCLLRRQGVPKHVAGDEGLGLLLGGHSEQQG